MADFPALPLWTDAYLADTRHLSQAEHGAYLLLLMEAWRRPRCCLPDDDALLARLSGSPSVAEWQAMKPAIMAFWTLDARASEWTQKRMSKERTFVEKSRKQKRDAARKRWQGTEKKDAAASPPHVQPTPTPTPTKESPNGDSSETSPPDKPRSLTPRERYPAVSNLPKNGKGLRYPPEFEAAWQAYPTRREDTKPGCYKHWRTWVVERRVDPETILDGARAYARAKAMDEHRFGFLRWCREGLWTHAPPASVAPLRPTKQNLMTAPEGENPYAYLLRTN